MKQFLLVISAIFALSSCNASPLLNHETAAKEKGLVIAPADENCPLEYPDNGLCAKVEWIVGPSLQNIDDTCLIKFWDKKTGTKDGPFIDPKPEQFVVVDPWMNTDSMHHPTSPVTVVKQEVGVYKATRIFFSMTGPWEFRVELKDGPNARDSDLIEGDLQMITIK